MGKLIDVATTHFSSQAIRSIHVREWDTTLYAKRMTLDDKARWLARSDGDTTDYMLYAVIYGLTDEKGETVFDIGDKKKLRESVDPEVISRLANFVLVASSEEDAEKN